MRLALPQDQIIAVHVDHGKHIIKILFELKIIFSFSISLGFLRHNESESVKMSLQNIALNLMVKNAFYTFFKGSTTVRKPGSLYNSETPLLCMTVNPEEKRKIIGDTFVKVTNEVIKELKLNPEEVFLAQGTLRPDLIESASHLVSTNADTIKTHHNDTDMIR